MTLSAQCEHGRFWHAWHGSWLYTSLHRKGLLICGCGYEARWLRQLYKKAEKEVF